MKINSPILYCCYNRLDLIKQSISLIQKINCKKIYISIDGPKQNELDFEKNKEVRNFIKNMKFSSNVEILERSKNLGCKLAVSEAINWLFKNEEFGIILEEDLLPSSDFFSFCDKLLKKYKDEEKIMMVSGSNYLGENISSNKYIYSEHFLIWGWATWRRAWKNYDLEMKNWKDDNIKKIIKNRYSKKEFDFLNNKFNSYYEDYFDTWDIQWYFSCIMNKGLTVMPEANLVSNIGLHGTHSDKFYETLFLKYGKIDANNLVSPLEIKRNTSFDLKIHKKFHFNNRIILKLKKIIKRIIN